MRELLSWRRWRAPATALSCILFVGLVPQTGRSAPARYEEDFSSSAFEDAVHSTAVWDTALGELRLADLPFTEEGSWAQNASWLVVGGGRAFAAVGSTIEILDLGNPLAPVLEGSISWAPQIVTPLCGAWDGRYLLVGSDTLISVFPLSVRHSLLIYDVQNPAAAAFVGSLDVSGTPRDILVQGGVAWMALDTGGVLGVDLSDPTAPVAGPVYTLFGPAQCLAAHGDMLYVGQAGLRGVTSKRQLGGTTLTNGSWSSGGFDVTDLEVEGSHLYATGLSFCMDFDLHSTSLIPTSETIVTASTAQDVIADGPWVAVAEGDGSVELFERISGQYSLRQTVSPASSAPNDFVRYGQHLLLAGSAGGVRVLSSSGEPVGGQPIAGGAFPFLLGGNGSNPFEADVDQDGDRLYAVGGSSVPVFGSSQVGLRVFDVSHPESPSQLGVYGSGSSSQFSRVSAENGVAWVIDYDRVRGIDTSVPVVMSELSTIYVGSLASPRDVLVQGSVLYLLTKDDLRSYDIQNPSTPTLLGSVTVTFPSELNQIVASGELLYLGDRAGGLGMRMIDVADPTSMLELGHIAGIRDVPQIAIEGNRLITAGLSLAVYDLTDPLSPTPMGVSSLLDWTAGARGLVVDGQRAYVTDLDDVLWVYDIGQPTAITRVGRYDPSVSTAADSWGLCLSGDHLFRYAWDLSGTQLYQQVESVKVRQRWKDLANQRIVSQGLAFDTRSIRAVRLTASSTGAPVFHVENEEFYPGSSPLEVPPNGQWTLLDPLTNAGNVFGQLRWTADLVPSADGTAPTVSHLVVEWLLEEPTVDAWSDVPGDEGGAVRLDWTRSGFDGDHTGIWPPVASYVVYRQPLAKATSSGLPALFPSSWDSVTTVAASGVDLYSAVVPVLADSVMNGAVTPRTLFIVQARPSGVFWGYDSAPVATFGLDNLDPAPSSALQVNYSPWDGPNRLTWTASVAPDVSRYRIYRATDPGLLDLTVVDSTASLTWSDVQYQQPGVYYAIDVVDDAGRRSPLTLTSTVTAATPTPTVTRLLPPAPNPFNPRTTVRFDLARPTAALRLEVLDIRGRRVRRLVDADLDAGSHSVVWNGRDDRGRAVGSGVYYLRLHAAGIDQVRKVALAR